MTVELSGFFFPPPLERKVQRQVPQPYQTCAVLCWFQPLSSLPRSQPVALNVCDVNVIQQSSRHGRTAEDDGGISCRAALPRRRYCGTLESKVDGPLMTAVVR